MNDLIRTDIPPELQSIASEVLLRSLDQSTVPLTARQIRERLTGPYKFPLVALESLLEQHVEAGRAYAYPGTGSTGKGRYWTRGIEEFARESVLKMVATRALPLAELLRRQRQALKGLNESAQRRLIAAMIADGSLHEWPPVLGSRTSRISALPPAPRLYLEDAVEKIARKIGVTPESMAGSLHELADSYEHGSKSSSTVSPLEDRLVERMLQVKLAAAQGAPLPLRELWHSLRSEGCDKTTFDRIVLDLAASYRVTLLKHDFPGMLTPTDRAELVIDQFGNHYVGIARR
jgi:hypothetical protein